MLYASQLVSWNLSSSNSASGFTGAAAKPRGIREIEKISRSWENRGATWQGASRFVLVIESTEYRR
jgi:hypothetical protein